MKDEIKEKRLQRKTDIATAFRVQRAKLNLRSSTVAKKANIDLTTYSRIERSISCPQFRTQIAICVALDLDPNSLKPIHWEGETEPKKCEHCGLDENDEFIKGNEIKIHTIRYRFGDIEDLILCETCIHTQITFLNHKVMIQVNPNKQEWKNE